MKALARRAAIVLLATGAAAAHAGGQLGLCNGAPLKYSGAGNVALNYDGGGTLGSRTKAQADAIVTTAIAKWTNVSTSSINLSRGADLPVDVTASNYTTYYNKFSDGLNPVIYDTNGSIIDAMLGAGQKSSVLGFAGSAWFGSPTCRYAEGQAVINGFISVSDGTMTNVIAHEVGHLIGLDHTQLDSTQGLSGSNYPLMYPIAYRTLSTLHDDDVSAVSALYPDASVSNAFGTLSGSFRLANGTTPVRGANIWARDSSNAARVISSVSDYFEQNNGNFSMLLPPGTYTLRAEAIASDFDSGSSVGPYSESYPSGLSFQSPLYVNGSPMAPVTLGNSNPMQITITAGCTASVIFRIDGNGTVGGNCGTVSGPGDGRLTAISTRGQVQGGNAAMIGGFIIGGSIAKTVVVRARGPSLAAAGITNPLADPVLQLVRASDNAMLAVNDNWSAAGNAAQISASGYAPTSGFESAVLMTLAPGAYTAIVTGANGSTGVGLVEVYELDTPQVPLTGISTRGLVLGGNDVMIGGFIVTGSGPQTVVIRARGPSLATAGITNGLPDPVLQLVRAADNATIAVNDNWSLAANAAQIITSGFAPTSPFEATILVTLAPGAYTAIVSGANGSTGVGIVEVFAVQ